MKILYHHRIRSKDGQNVHMVELIHALRDNNQEVMVVGPSIVEDSTSGSGAGYSELLKRWLPGFIYEFLELGYSIPAAIRLIIAIIKFKPDVIYERYNLFFPIGVLISRLNKIPIILEVNSPLFEERRRYGGLHMVYVANKTETYTWKNATHVLPVTKILAEYIQNRGINPDQISVIPNGISQSWLTSSENSTEAKIRLKLQGKLVLGFVGFIKDWHSLDRVFPVINANKQAYHLLVVGDGPAKKLLEAKTQSMGLQDNVTFTGIVGRNDVPKYVAAFDIALQPHVVSYASPLKLFEYMASSKAIIAPDTKNIKEILEHNVHALLFNPENDHEFIREVEKLCSNKELRLRIATNARNRIDEMGLTWNHNARQVVSIAGEYLSK